MPVGCTIGGRPIDPTPQRLKQWVLKLPKLVVTLLRQQKTFKGANPFIWTSHLLLIETLHGSNFG